MKLIAKTFKHYKRHQITNKGSPTNPKEDKLKEICPGNIIVRVLENKNKMKIFKRPRDKRWIIFIRAAVRLDSDFQTEAGGQKIAMI
jgi:hypothetical protein